MKKIFALFAVASMGVMGMQAQTVAELEAKQAEVKAQLDNYDDGIAKKWEFRFDGAYESNLGEDKGEMEGLFPGEDGALVNLGVGYNLNSNWYLGLATGFNINAGRVTGGPSPKFVPLMLDVTRRWNGDGEKWSFFVEGRGGYAFSVAKDRELGNGKTYEFPNAWMADAQLGVYYRIRRNIDLRFSVGYLHINPAEDTPDISRNTNSLVAKVGMNFRKAPKMPTRSELQNLYDNYGNQLEAARAAEEAARQAELRRQAEEAARKAAAEEAARRAAEEEAARRAAEEADKNKEVVLFYEIRLSDITAEHNAQLDDLVAWVNTHQVDKIVIKGYADRETGNPRLNVGYARNRAEKVKKTLIKKYGIDKNMIECSSYGDTEQPFSENIKNRCTIIVVNQK